MMLVGKLLQANGGDLSVLNSGNCDNLIERTKKDNKKHKILIQFSL